MNYPAGVTPQAPAKSGFPTWAIVVIVVVVGIVGVVGVMGALAMFGMRKYIADAKTAEARNSVAQLAKDAAAAYARDGKLCPSASAPVPTTVPRAAKYQSTAGDWAVDKATNAGFACLRFEMDAPQYYQYTYTSTPTSFTVTARGDLDGNGKTSSFSVEGRVSGGSVVVAPTILETDPRE